MNWRSIKTDGLPKDPNIKYLVTDGQDISTSDVGGVIYFKKDKPPKFIFKSCTGDDNTNEDNDCCSGEKVFDMTPTHWLPVNEIKLPIK